MTKYYKHRNCSRILSMFLAFILTLSLLPMSALATNGAGVDKKKVIIDEGSETTGDNFEGKGTHVKWRPVGAGKIFLRLSIIQFDKGVENWQDSSTLIGSLDVSSDLTSDDMKKVQLWWDTNAFDSMKKEKKAAGTWKDYYKDSPGVAGYSSRFVPFTKETFGRTIPDLFGDGAVGTDNMLKLFTHEVDGKVVPNDAFNKVIALISGEYELDANDFIKGNATHGSGAGSCDYRLVIEPGVLTLIDGTVAAMTFRDMLAYSLNNPTTPGENKTPAFTWNTSSQNLAYGLYLTRDEFVTGVGEEAEAPGAGNAAFNKVSESPVTGTDGLKFSDFRSKAKDTGYGLSIINPGDMGGSEYNSYVGRVNIFLPTGAELAAGPGAEPSKNIGTEYYSYLGKRGELVEALINLPN